MPRASDFERVLPGATAGGDSATVASRGRSELVVLRPGRAFDLVGFRWSAGRAPAISLQSLGVRGWSRWVTVGTSGEDGPDGFSLTGESRAEGSSAPVWTGEARALRIRVSGRPARGLRAHFVNVSGPAVTTAAPAARAAATGGVGPGTKTKRPPAATVPSPSKPQPPKTSGNNPAPAIVPRADWGADACPPRVTPAYGEVLGVAVHHTESTNTYSAAQAPSVVLGICRYHRNSNGWNDIGYNLLVDRFGTVYEGRSGGTDLAVVGAHSEGYNMQMAGIAMIGSHVSARPGGAAMESLRAAVKWKLGLAGITRSEGVGLISSGGSHNRFAKGKLVFVRPVSGHRDLDSTACPGGALYNLLPRVAPQLKGGSRSPSRMSLRVARSTDGTSAVVSGRLRGKGRVLAGRKVEVQAYTPMGWVKVTDATTDAGGVWTATVAPVAPQYVRGMFSGSSGFRPVRSPWLQTPKLVTPAPSRRRR